MSLLQQIEQGKKASPPRILLYGQEGVGKSSCAAQTPRPIFIQTEDGLAQIECHKFPLATELSQVVQYIEALVAEPHDYQTIVIDSLDWLERLIFDEVCRSYGVTSIERCDGGYGRGYIQALSYWRKFLNRLSVLHSQQGMMIMLVAHAKVERFEDPDSSSYDRYSPRLHKHACALVSEWCDAVLFATRKFRVEREDAGFNRERGVAHAIGKDGGERILRTVGGPSCVAKNRYNLDAELPLEWNSLLAGITANCHRTEPLTG